MNFEFRQAGFGWPFLIENSRVWCKVVAELARISQMKKLFLLIGVLLSFIVPAIAQTAPAPPPMTLKVGDVAPDFTLPDTAGNKVKLSDFRGKNNVVLAFFVLAFTGG